MRGKLAKALRRMVRSVGKYKSKAYRVAKHTIREKVYHHPWQDPMKDEPVFRYTTGTFELIPDCERHRYQQAKHYIR